MSESDSPTSIDRTIPQALLSHLGGFRRKVRDQLLLEGVTRLLAAIAVLAAVTFVLDRMFRLSVPARLILLTAGLITMIWLARREIWIPLRLKLDPLTLASVLDQRYGSSVTARVASVLELPSLLQKPSPPSAAMVAQAVRDSFGAVSALDFSGHLDQRRRKGAAVAIVGLFAAASLLWIAAPATVNLWAARLFLGSNRPWPQKTYLQIAGLENGTLVVPRGEPFVLRAAARSGSTVPDGVTLRFREGGAPRVRAAFTAFAANDFRYGFSGINAAVSAEVWGGDDYAGPFTIRPAERPRVVDLKLTTQHPTESKPTTYNFSGADSDLVFLPLTQMHLLFGANTDIAEAHITSSTTRPSARDLHRIDDRHFSLDWVHQRDVQLKIELISRDARLASVPTEVAIGLKIDQPPRVAMGYTGVHLRITPQARIPLTVDARDDYAVAAVSLALKLERPDPSSPGTLLAEMQKISLYGPRTPATEPQVQEAKTMELQPWRLPPGSLLTVNAAAVDACYTGPQTGQSRQVTFRIVPPEELFREILLRQQAERAKFRKQAAEALAIRGQIGVAGMQTESAHRHRAVQREVNSVAAALIESVTEMRLNSLATPEAYDLIEKNVLSPLKSLNIDLLNPQKDALDALKADDAAAIAGAQNRQDQIVSRMDEILKQMSQWDSFVDVLNQLNEVIRVQEQAEQTTNQLKKQQTEGVFEK